MTPVLPKEIEELEVMADHFNILIKTEKSNKDFLVTFDDGDGIEGVCIKALRYLDNTFHFFDPENLKRELTKADIFDILYGINKTSKEREK